MNHEPTKGCPSCQKAKPLAKMRRLLRNGVVTWRCTKCLQAAKEKHLRCESAKYPAHLIQIPESEWPYIPPYGLCAVWRSNAYLVQVYQTPGRPVRLSIIRTKIRGSRYADKIPWDDLQRLKRECGYGGVDAVEVYPAEKDVVNVANMRHLWLVGDVTFAWRNV